MQAGVDKHIPELNRVEFYRQAIDVLDEAGLPFLIGGTYALERYTGIQRVTKDLDLFVHPRDFERILDRFDLSGYKAEVTFPHWLGKVHFGNCYVDIIFSSGNGLAQVDDLWFEHAVPGSVLGKSVLLVPPEEGIWSRAFVMERERYDGADVAHLLLACAGQLDWQRLLLRFGDHWRLLLSHLVLFGYIYPTQRDIIPGWLMDELLARLHQEQSASPIVEPVCQGTMLSREQYLIDVKRWGYEDARLPPRGNLSPEAVAEWTAAIHEQKPAPATDSKE